MKVRINVDKVTALHAGTDRHGLMVVEVPASEFTTEERAILARHVYNQRNDEPRADFYLDQPSTLGGYHYKRSNFYDHILMIAVAPTPEDVHAVLKAIAEADAKVRADIEAEKEEAARKREEAIRSLLESETEGWMWDDYGRWKLRAPLGFAEIANDPRIAARLPIIEAEIVRRNAEREERKAREKAEQMAQEEAEALKAKAEKGEWIIAHGSDHLKLAYGAGYDCQRLYVTERARVEHPHFVIDFDNLAGWRSRSCPSETALAEALAEAMAVEGDCEVVWLTSPAWTVDEDDEEGFEPGEALVIREYLGKYDLVKMV